MNSTLSNRTPSSGSWKLAADKIIYRNKVNLGNDSVLPAYALGCHGRHHACKYLAGKRSHNFPRISAVIYPTDNLDSTDALFHKYHVIIDNYMPMNFFIAHLCGIIATP